MVAVALHIAGVGASAGGLEAMLPMFACMRPTGRIAFVVAQHMAKDGHDELVVRLIRRESALPVVLVEEGMRLVADKVYVIPSGKDGRVKGEDAEARKIDGGSQRERTAKCLSLAIQQDKYSQSKAQSL